MRSLVIVGIVVLSVAGCGSSVISTGGDAGSGGGSSSSSSGAGPTGGSSGSSSSSGGGSSSSGGAPSSGSSSSGGTPSDSGSGEGPSSGGSSSSGGASTSSDAASDDASSTDAALDADSSSSPAADTSVGSGSCPAASGTYLFHSTYASGGPLCQQYTPADQTSVVTDAGVTGFGSPDAGCSGMLAGCAFSAKCDSDAGDATFSGTIHSDGSIAGTWSFSTTLSIGGATFSIACLFDFTGTKQ